MFLCVATTLLTTGQGIVVPILPLYARTFQVSTAEIGLVISVFGLARFLTNMPAAVLSDRWGRRVLLVGGPLVAAVGNLLVVLAGALGPLLLYRFVAGIGTAAFITGAVIFIADVAPARNRGQLLSFYQGSFALGVTLGPALGGLIAESFGLRAPFIAVAAVSVASGLWALFRVPETRWNVRSAAQAEGATARGSAEIAAEGDKTSATNSRLSAYSFLLSRGFVLISLVFIGNFFTRGGAVFVLLPLKAAVGLGLSPRQLGALFSMMSVLDFCAVFAAGYLADRFGRKRVIVPGVMAFGCGIVIMGLSDTVWLFAVGLAIYGAAHTMAGGPAVAYVADISPPGRQAVAQATVRSLGDLALVVAPPLVGLAADAVGIGNTLMANGALNVLVGLTVLMFIHDPYYNSLRTAKQKL